MSKVWNELGKRILFLDGGMGSQLQERGLVPGELPETWNLNHADRVKDIHRAYIDAGADIILANTFGANEFKFDNLEEIVTAGIVNAKEAVAESQRDVMVALDLGPTGKLLKPMGTLPFEEAVRVYSQVVSIAAKAGADIIVIETMSDTYELKAAVLAAKENSDLPIIATVAFGENEKLLTGATPEAVVALLEGLRVDALGMNCGLGPEQMNTILHKMTPICSTPIAISPNAGLPRTENGQTVYDVDPEEFSLAMEEIVKGGAWIVGGCCGTTPAHIRAMVERCKNLTPRTIESKDVCVVSSYSHAVFLGNKPMIIGERINPTGKKKFKQALRDHDMEYILEEGVKQADAGAHILDVNVGLPEIDEVAVMKDVVTELQSVLNLPLQIDTSDPVAMEAAMRLYNGKPMINSVNGKAEVMHAIFPLVARYGGVVVGLTLDEEGIPNTPEGRMAIAERIYDTAAGYGIAAKDIVIDALTMTMSTDNKAAEITLETVRRVKAQGGRTVLGVSNISFGLPQREMINATFYSLAMQAGLSAGIINPNVASMIQAYDTFCVLGGFDEQCQDYVTRYAAMPKMVYVPADSVGTGTEAAGTGSATTTSVAAQTTLGLKDYIIKGLKEPSYKATQTALQTREAMDIINEDIVAALDVVGAGFEKGTMFLPQLLMSAEAAQSAFEAIKEHMLAQGGNNQKKATIILATVKGDIHDIGKNIVKVLLENYGYEVIDLGKDVPVEVIVEATIQHHAPLVGLSALMTTTVVNMEETIKALHAQAPWAKIMVGGAVLTQEYADMIGADFYGKDAMKSVYYAEELLNKE